MTEGRQEIRPEYYRSLGMAHAEKGQGHIIS